MNNYLQALNLNLCNEGENAKIRQQVLSAQNWQPTPTTNVAYVSANRVLVISSPDKAAKIHNALPEKMLCYIAVPAEKSGSVKAGNTFNCAGLVVNGYLGRFEVLLDQHLNKDDEINDNLANILGIESGLFDQILDCSDQPLIAATIKPPGYHFVGNDIQLLEDALENIPQMIGEFEKPKYFDYNPDICAHGRSGITGCTNCLDACPTDAIISIGETIEVNPHLCQGGGTCASSCPTGAITYIYPKAEEQIEFLRVMLKSWRQQNQNLGATLLLFDQERGLQDIESIADQLDGHVIPFIVEEIGSAGLDLISAALAYGANHVLIYVAPQTPTQCLETVQRNAHIIREVLLQTNCQSHSVEIIYELDSICNCSQFGPITIEQAATFSAIGGKRSTIRSALSFFNEIATNPIETVTLSESAPFGQVHLNQEACTLCMGCVSTCPAGALIAGGESPALRFIEANCVQCGICTRTCPESATTLEPRLHFDYNIVNKAKTLKEEAPFLCVSCAKPFATQAMIHRMTEKLQGHWMFNEPDALNRLRMCEDCRVKDMFDKDDLIS